MTDPLDRATPLSEQLAAGMFGMPLGQLDAEERRVVDGIAAHRPISRDMVDEDELKSTGWGRLADRVAAVGGSWGFIIGFSGVLVAWMLLNTDVLAHWNLAFDPYPYIFLNLMLSMTAALQAPIIMMSQNRQSAKDRIAARHDYEVNLRAEIEIMRLHQKLDALKFDRIEALLQRMEARLD